MSIIIIALAMLCLLGTVLELFYSATLQEFSRDAIIFMQLPQDEVIDGLFKLLEYFTAGVFTFVSVMIFFCSRKRIGAIGVILGASGACFASLLKMMFAHPRPLYAFANIRAVMCSNDFGFPSGHLFSAGGVTLFLGYHWVKSSSHSIIKIALMAISLIIVAVDRLYLGMHFHFQVLMGFLYSALIVSIIVHPSNEKKFRRIFTRINELIYLHAFGVFFIITGSILYMFRNASMDHSWLTNYTSKCEGDLTADGALLKNFDQSTMFAGVVGFCAGYYYSKKVPTVGFDVQTVSVSLGLLGIFSGVGYLLEFAFKNWLPIPAYLVLDTIVRYLVGFSISYGIPKILYSFTRQAEKFQPVP